MNPDTIFQNATDEELRIMRRELLAAQQIARTYSYNTADREIGEMLNEILIEREYRAEREAS